MKFMKIACVLVLCAVVAVTTGPASSASASQSSPSALNGVYRIKWTEQQLVAAGTSPLYARRNHAVITLTIRDGHDLIRYTDPSTPDCRAAFTATGIVLSINFHVPSCPGGVGLIKARWSLQNGLLRLQVLVATDPGDKIAWGSKPWKKIG